MTEIKYPQITQITQISLWGEQRPGVLKKSGATDHIRSRSPLWPRLTAFCTGTIVQCLGQVQESFGATDDLWPYPKPLKKSA
jgi:hypothetical protein